MSVRKECEKVMNCLNRFCIFNNFDECTNTEEIEIDWRGFCKNMIPVRIPRTDLKGKKDYTKLVLKIDKNYYFDKEIGMVTMTDEAHKSYDKEFFE